MGNCAFKPKQDKKCFMLSRQCNSCSNLVDLVQAIMMLLDQKLSERKKRATSMEWQYRVLEAMGTMTGPSTGSTARVVTISSPYTRLTAVNLSTRDFNLPADIWVKSFKMGGVY